MHAQPTGDALFPPIAETEWRETARREGEASAEDEATFTFISYARAANAP